MSDATALMEKWRRRCQLTTEEAGELAKSSISVIETCSSQTTDPYAAKEVAKLMVCIDGRALAIPVQLDLQFIVWKKLISFLKAHAGVLDSNEAASILRCLVQRTMLVIHKLSLLLMMSPPSAGNNHEAISLEVEEQLGLLIFYSQRVAASLSFLCPRLSEPAVSNANDVVCSAIVVLLCCKGIIRCRSLELISQQSPGRIDLSTVTSKIDEFFRKAMKPPTSSNSTGSSSNNSSSSTSSSLNNSSKTDASSQVDNSCSETYGAIESTQIDYVELIHAAGSSISSLSNLLLSSSVAPKASSFSFSSSTTSQQQHEGEGERPEHIYPAYVITFLDSCTKIGAADALVCELGKFQLKFERFRASQCPSSAAAEIAVVSSPIIDSLAEVGIAHAGMFSDQVIMNIASGMAKALVEIMKTLEDSAGRARILEFLINLCCRYADNNGDSNSISGMKKSSFAVKATSKIATLILLQTINLSSSPTLHCAVARVLAKVLLPLQIQQTQQQHDSTVVLVCLLIRRFLLVAVDDAAELLLGAVERQLQIQSSSGYNSSAISSSSCSGRSFEELLQLLPLAQLATRSSCSSYTPNPNNRQSDQGLGLSAMLRRLIDVSCRSVTFPELTAAPSSSSARLAEAADSNNKNGKRSLDDAFTGTGIGSAAAFQSWSNSYRPTSSPTTGAGGISSSSSAAAVATTVSRHSLSSLSCGISLLSGIGKIPRNIPAAGGTAPGTFRGTFPEEFFADSQVAVSSSATVVQVLQKYLHTLGRYLHDAVQYKLDVSANKIVYTLKTISSLAYALVTASKMDARSFSPSSSSSFPTGVFIATAKSITAYAERLCSLSLSPYSWCAIPSDRAAAGGFGGGTVSAHMSIEIAQVLLLCCQTACQLLTQVAVSSRLKEASFEICKQCLLTLGQVGMYLDSQVLYQADAEAEACPLSHEEKEGGGGGRGERERGGGGQGGAGKGVNISIWRYWSVFLRCVVPFADSLPAELRSRVPTLVHPQVLPMVQAYARGRTAYAPGKKILASSSTLASTATDVKALLVNISVEDDVMIGEWLWNNDTHR